MRRLVLSLAALSLLIPFRARAQAADGITDTDQDQSANVSETVDALSNRVALLEDRVAQLEQQPEDRQAERAARAQRLDALIQAAQSLDQTLSLGQYDVGSTLGALRSQVDAAYAEAEQTASRLEATRVREAQEALAAAAEAVNRSDLAAARNALWVMGLGLTRARDAALAN